MVPISRVYTPPPPAICDFPTRDRENGHCKAPPLKMVFPLHCMGRISYREENPNNQGKQGQGCAHVNVWVHTCVVYFLSSLRGQTAKTLICTKSGVSADFRKSALFAHFFAQKVRFSALFGTFRHSFRNRRKPHFLCRLMFLPFGL